MRSKIFLLVFILVISMTCFQVKAQDAGSRDVNFENNLNDAARDLSLERNERFLEEIKKIWSYVKPALAGAILNYLNNTQNGKRALKEIPNENEIDQETADQILSFVEPVLAQAILNDLNNKTKEKRDFEENLNLRLQKKSLWEDLKNAFKQAATEYLDGLKTQK